MGAGTYRSNNPTASAGHQVVTDEGGSAMCCEVDDEFTAAMNPGDAAVGRVGEIMDDGHGVLRLIVDGQVVAKLDPGEPVSRLRSCLGRGFRFLGAATGPGVVRVTNA